MRKIATLLFIIPLLVTCGFNNLDRINPNSKVLSDTSLIDSSANTIETRIKIPVGFDRIEYPDNSYQTFLRTFKLKNIEHKVHYYDGTIKEGLGKIYISVLDIDVGNRDLQQCADAVMRMRGEYLFKQKQFDKIHFNFLSDGKPRYFKDYTKDYSYKNFRKYMNYIFSYANTWSLKNEMVKISIDSIQPGDIFIKAYPDKIGHTVFVVDVAKNKDTGEKLFIVAQSYMPAQEMQILVNPNNTNISPWYSNKFDKTLDTPEYTFEKGDLYRFKEE